MNIAIAARQLDTAIARKVKPANLEEIQTEMLLARGRISDEVLDQLQDRIAQVSRYESWDRAIAWLYDDQLPR